MLDPLSGFYDEPVVTLDFASLYPSIMQSLGRGCFEVCVCVFVAPPFLGSGLVMGCLVFWTPFCLAFFLGGVL